MEIHMNGNGHKLLPTADLEVELRRLQEELAKEQEKNLRTLSDFTNYRRRIERDGNTIAKVSKREMMLLLLDIVDDMEKMLQHSNKKERSTVNGGEIIHRKFLALLETYGVVPFASAGAPFDHTLHEPVAMVKHEGSESGTVVDEVRRGYFWNDELLRPAQVLIAEW